MNATIRYWKQVVDQRRREYEARKVLLDEHQKTTEIYRIKLMEAERYLAKAENRQGEVA